MISSARMMLAKIGPLRSSNVPCGAIEDHAAGDIAGQQVGRKLDALEIQAQHFGKAPRHQRLTQAGEIFEQDVAARQNGRHHHLQ